MIPPALDQAISALPEQYQPIFGHPEYDSRASRGDPDRLHATLAVHDALAATLGRPLRVLDLGCAQGLFSLGLAARGARVTGIDAFVGNVDVCELLRAENPRLDVRFALERLEDRIPGLAGDEFDLVLALNVFHHVCAAQGVEAARALLNHLVPASSVTLVEVGIRAETAPWASALPSDPRDLLGAFPFVHRIGRFPTHLSEVERPLFFCSAHYWFFDGRLERFSAWTDMQHAAAGNVFGGTRRYFFGEELLCKYFRLTGDLATVNGQEIRSEAAVLSRSDLALPHRPSVHGTGSDESAAWLVRDLVPGRLLSELVAQGAPYDPWLVVRQVLDQLCTLELSGLYHSDVRVWNVLMTPADEAVLIDYGSIGQEPRDCVWPHDVFLAFALFVREVVAREIPRTFPTRPPLLAPRHLAEPYAAWMRAALSLPESERTFARLRSLLDDATSDATPATSTSPVELDRWRAAVERNLDIVGAQLEHVRHWLEIDWHAPRERNEISMPVAGKRALPSLFDQLDALGRALAETRTECLRLDRSTQGMPSRLAELERAMDGVRSGLVEFRRDVSALETSRDALETSRTALERTSDALEKDLDQTRAAVEALANTTRAMERSRVWRALSRLEALFVRAGVFGRGDRGGSS